jgi:hypothetical protein
LEIQGGHGDLKVKMVLPALIEATSPLFRPIKYSLFPPLGLATLAGYLNPEDDVTIEDEHVEHVRLDDEPDLVVIQVYITSASRAYRCRATLWMTAWMPTGVTVGDNG